MNINPTVNCPLNLPNNGNIYPISKIYSYQYETPNNISIMLSNTNLNTNYIVHGSNDENFFSHFNTDLNANEKKPSKKSKDLCNFQEELIKEKQKNQILIAKIIELERLLSQKNDKKLYNDFKNKGKKKVIVKEPLNPMEKDKEISNENENAFNKIKENRAKNGPSLIIGDNQQKIDEKNMTFIKNLENKIEAIIKENERLSNFFHEQYKELEKKQQIYEEQNNKQTKKLEKLLFENEKLRKFIDEMRENFERHFKAFGIDNRNLYDLNLRLQKENNLIVNSVAITNEKQQIEKNKLAVISEQNSYLENKNKILQDENKKLKAKF